MKDDRDSTSEDSSDYTCQDSSDSDSDFRPVIIDNGTEYCRAGFAGADAPSVIVPTCIDSVSAGTNNHDSQVGYFATLPTYPIQHGIVSNWDAMEQIWHHMYKRLGVLPEDHCVLLTDSALNPKVNREKVLEIMFEKFGVVGVHITMAAIPCLYASGRTTGTVVDSGGGSTCVVSVVEGYPIPSAIRRTDVGGRDVSDYLTLLLAQRGLSFSTPFERTLVQKLKDELSYIAYDFDAEVEKEQEQLYVLPDGQTIRIGDELFRAPEVLFRPSLLLSNDAMFEQRSLHTSHSDSLDVLGVSELVHNSITNCEADVRKDLHHNIILSGGNTLCSGFKVRLEKDLHSISSSALSTKIIELPERLFSTWIGCSILASLSHNSIPEWICKDRYDEDGPAIVHKVCI